MAALDTFASTLLEEAKYFLEKAVQTVNGEAKMAYLHSALLLAFAAFEAHVNAIADDFLARGDLQPHERGLLAEHAVELIDGEFRERNSLRIQRIEDRVLFLCRRFSKKPIDRQASYWSGFVEAARLRNSLTHPKSDPPSVGENAVSRALTSVIELLNVMYLSIYKKKLPAHGRGLSSRLQF
jgi:hypothetical protein